MSHEVAESVVAVHIGRKFAKVLRSLFSWHGRAGFSPFVVMQSSSYKYLIRYSLQFESNNRFKVMRLSNPIESQHTVCDLKFQSQVDKISWHTNENTHCSARVALFLLKKLHMKTQLFLCQEVSD